MSSSAPLEDGDAPRGLISRLRATSGTQRALILYGAALLFGVLVVPFLIFLVGSRVLGPYTQGQNLHGGPFALLWDFLTGLAHGSAVFWAVALGPVVLILLLRLFVRALRLLRPRG